LSGGGRVTAAPPSSPPSTTLGRPGASVPPRDLASAVGNRAPVTALPLRASLSLPAGADRRLTLRYSRTADAVTSLRSELKARLAVREMGRRVPPFGTLGDASSPSSAGAGWKLSAIGGAALLLTRRGGKQLSGTVGGGKAGKATVPTESGAASGAEPTAAQAAHVGPAFAEEQDGSSADTFTDTFTDTSSISARGPGVSTSHILEPTRGPGARLARLRATEQLSVALPERAGAGVAGSSEISAAVRLARFSKPSTAAEPPPFGGSSGRRGVHLPSLTDLILTVRLRAPLTRVAGQQRTPELILDHGAHFGDAATLRVRASLPLRAKQSSGSGVAAGAAGSRAPSVRAAVSLAL